MPIDVKKNIRIIISAAPPQVPAKTSHRRRRAAVVMPSADPCSAAPRGRGHRPPKLPPPRPPSTPRGLLDAAWAHTRAAVTTTAASLRDPLQIAREAAMAGLIGVYIGAGLAALTGLYSLTVPLVAVGATVGATIGLGAALLKRHRHLRHACAGALRRIDREHIAACAARVGRAAIDAVAAFLATGARQHAGSPVWAPGLVWLAVITGPAVFSWLSSDPAPA